MENSIHLYLWICGQIHQLPLGGPLSFLSVICSTSVRRRPTTPIAAVVALAATLLGAPTATALPAAVPATGPGAVCAPLGTAQFPPGQPPNTSQAGLGAFARATRPGLPHTVALRTPEQSFNQRWDFALVDRVLYTRPRGTAGWRTVALPPCLQHRLRAISLDDDEMLAVDSRGTVFTMDNLLREPASWNWTHAWGAPLWQGNGTRLPSGTGDRWAWSVSSPWTTRTWTDSAGNRQPLGQGKVSHIISLVGDGSRIVTQDPWLADDYSYEIGTPHNGRFQAAAISAAGSTTFIVNRLGDMYTRLYDFDSSGSDIVFYRYSWLDQRGKPSASELASQRVNPGYAAVQLPAPGWRRQPKIPGEITAAISIHQTGAGSSARELRVAGRRDGATGYWHKPIDARSWAFTHTGAALTSPIIANPPTDTSAQTLAAPSLSAYRATLPTRGPVAGYVLSVREFAWAVSARTATVTAPNGVSFPVVLHTIDGLRQLPRAAGLSAEPRDMYGAIELVPGPPSPERSAFRRAWLGGTTAPVSISITTAAMLIR